MKKHLLLWAGILLSIPLIVAAINITVPSAPSAGYFLTSTSTGAYIATSTLGANFGSINATSTATSSFAGPLNAGVSNSTSTFTGAISSGQLAVTGLGNSAIVTTGNAGSYLTTASIGTGITFSGNSLSNSGVISVSCTTITCSGTNPASFSIGNGAISNTQLANSTISGVALGGTLSSLSHDATLNGTSYNGSASVSNWGLNLGNANTWTALQTINDLIGLRSTTTSATTTNLFANIGLFNGPLSIGTTTATTTIYGNSTSTFTGGVNLTAGCLAVNSVCIGSGLSQGSVGSGTAGQVPYYSNTGTALAATSSIVLPTTSNVIIAGGIATSTQGDTNGAYLGRLAFSYATATPGTDASIVFTGAKNSTSTFTYGSPGTVNLPSNTAYFTIEMWGAGGGSGGGGQNGGPGGNGTSGTSSCFSIGTLGCYDSTTVATSTGGTFGGGGLNSATNAPGGKGTGGDVNLNGQGGGNPSIAGLSYGGTGGSAPRGGGGAGGNLGAGINGEPFGGGASGGYYSASSGNGGSGGGGGGYFLKTITAPLGAKYKYTIGAGGAGGPAGGGGSAGAAGGSGGMVITVYTY